MCAIGAMGEKDKTESKHADQNGGSEKIDLHNIVIFGSKCSSIDFSTDMGEFGERGSLSRGIDLLISIKLTFQRVSVDTKEV